MKSRSCLVVWACMGLGAILAAGCKHPPERLNAPPQGHSAYPHEMQAQYVPMVDNTLLAEMSMSPVHFVPHQTELNGTGVRRLSRYVSILRVYGGTLHYDGLEEPDELAEERMVRIRHFLVSAGLGPNDFRVDRGVAGGSGMDGKEAGEIRQTTRFDPARYQGETNKSPDWVGGK